MTLEELAERFELWRERLPELGLLHWRIDVGITDEPAGIKTAHAACSPDTLYDHANIDVATEALEMKERALDELIVHELLHVAFRDYNEAIHSQCDGFAAGVQDAFDERVLHEMEGVVERLARSIVSCYYST